MWIIPHGIYDLARNCGHINIGLGHDTSRFAFLGRDLRQLRRGKLLKVVALAFDAGS